MPAEDIIWWHTSVSRQLKDYSSHYRIWTNCDTWQIPEHMLVKSIFFFLLPSTSLCFPFFILWSLFTRQFWHDIEMLLFIFSLFGRAVKKKSFLSTANIWRVFNIMAKKFWTGKKSKKEPIKTSYNDFRIRIVIALHYVHMLNSTYPIVPTTELYASSRTTIWFLYLSRTLGTDRNIDKLS